MTTLNLSIEVADEILQYLQEEATNRQVALDLVVGDILSDYFAELTEDEIVESIKIGMKQAFAGEGHPAREALAEIDREVMGDAYDG